MVDALNGTSLTFETALFFRVVNNIRLRLDERWGVDGMILLDTLRPAQLAGRRCLGAYGGPSVGPSRC